MSELKWWQSAVFYQIYPRSFADGNGDGIGDFAGMTARLDHLKDLGIGAIWLSPHYPSPYVDCGYDISDFSGVAPEYGTMGDFKTFLREAHARDIHVVIDVVFNHSSDQHPWFTESRSSRDNPKRDWYMWRDGRDGGPPNNWVSIFGGPAWTLDPATGQYYYHAFLREQPDLNWRNPEVKQAMWDMVRFWLDLGVDGLRLDAIGTIFEDPRLPDHPVPVPPGTLVVPNGMPPEKFRALMQYQIDQPGLHELMKDLRRLTDEFPGDRMLIGEDDQPSFHGNGDDELHMVFNFPLSLPPLMTPPYIRANQTERLAALPPGAWPCNTLGNHDRRRIWSRYGDGVHDAALARLNAALMLTLKGTPFLYNGEEIGMTDLELTDISQFRDTAALSQYRILTTSNGMAPEAALSAVALTTRDRCRSPMHWSSAPNAGFSPSEVSTWLPVHDNHASGINVADQQGDPGSMLSFYQRLIHLRQATPALVAGDYEAVDPQSDEVLAFLRRDAASGQTCLVVLNYSDSEALIDLGGKKLRRLFSNGLDAEPGPLQDPLTVDAFEVLIAEVV